MEIIKRTSEPEKQTVSTKGYNEKMQVSFNNFGHIALRFFDSEFTPMPAKTTSVCKYCHNPIHTIEGVDTDWNHDTTGYALCIGVTDPDYLDKQYYATPNEEIPMTKPQETLVVLDAVESRDLIRFIKERLQ